MKKGAGTPIGVILLNLGGPERLADVRPFLYNLFSDRKIIRLGPPFLQKPIAWMIAKRRAPKSSRAYKLIGGGSPLNRLTREQGAALAHDLVPYGAFTVDMAMRYWHPFADETLRSMAAAGISRLVALTLYPHYSKATTGSSLDDLRRVAASFSPGFDIAEIAAWPEQPDYVRCLADTIVRGMEQFAGKEVRLLYSAHSLPVSFIREGDPYLEHLQETIGAVEKLTGVAGTLCFQSRSGPVEWLAPSTPDTLREVAGLGCRQVLLVPLSFVSDHVETLYEIDIEYRELAAGLGMELARTESLNVMPTFITGLKNLVLEAARARQWLE
ncbi:MAG: ferrochelatase [Thermodesulfobacteriota bacterium]